MAKRATIRLGIGEAIPPGCPSLMAQRIFLERLFDVTEAQPAIRELVRISDAPARNTRPGLFVEPAVMAWALKWHLDEPVKHKAGLRIWWLLRTMQHHVNHWREFPRYRGRLCFFGQVYHEPDWPHAPSWNPITTTEEHYRFAIDRYIREIKKSAEYVDAPVQREMQHFVSFVLYQVAGWAAARIAKEHSSLEGGGTKAVSKAVRKMASRIGLGLRRAPRGRPSKKATQESAS